MMVAEKKKTISDRNYTDRRALFRPFSPREEAYSRVETTEAEKWMKFSGWTSVFQRRSKSLLLLLRYAYSRTQFGRRKSEHTECNINGQSAATQQQQQHFRGGTCGKEKLRLNFPSSFRVTKWRKLFLRPKSARFSNRLSVKVSAWKLVRKYKRESQLSWLIN